MYRVETFRAFLKFKLNFLASLQRSIPFHVDGRVVGENVAALFFAFNKTETFRIIEPLNLARCHTSTSSCSHKLLLLKALCFNSHILVVLMFLRCSMAKLVYLTLRLHKH